MASDELLADGDGEEYRGDGRISENGAADVDGNPGVRPSRIGLQRAEQRVTARMHRTEGGEVVAEYKIGGETFDSLAEAFPDVSRN